MLVSSPWHGWLATSRENQVSDLQIYRCLTGLDQFQGPPKFQLTLPSDRYWSMYPTAALIALPGLIQGLSFLLFSSLSFIPIAMAIVCWLVNAYARLKSVAPGKNSPLLPTNNNVECPNLRDVRCCPFWQANGIPRIARVLGLSPRLFSPSRTPHVKAGTSLGS